MDTWVLTEKMMQWLEGAHVSLLRQVTRKQATWRKGGSCQQVTSEAVLQVAGTQTLRTYMDRQHDTVVEWVAIRPIFGVFDRETGY